jgi:alpha-mannosidase
MYSTPTIYIDAVYAEKRTWPTNYNDMLPLNSYGVWSGFYSSRANLKEYVRRAERLLHASNKLFALNSVNEESLCSDFAKDALAAKENMMDVVGVMQHHDAVTGTSRQNVADDYNRLIFKQLEATNPLYARALSFWANKTGFNASDWQWCVRTNSTFADCPINRQAYSKDLKMLVVAHNPANLPMKTLNIAVPHGNLSV